MSEGSDSTKISRAIGFLMKLARALHTYGMPSHRLEVALRQVSERMEVESQFLVTPTGIHASVGPTGASQNQLLRLEPGRINLKVTSTDHLGAMGRGEGIGWRRGRTSEWACPSLRSGCA